MTTENDVAAVANRVLVDVNAIRLVKNAFAFCFKEARFSTPGGSDVEHNKYYGQVLTFMRALTSKDGDLLSHFDKNDESGDEIRKISLKHHLINNHDIAANKGKIKGHLPLEHIFGLCGTFKKFTKKLRFIIEPSKQLIYKISFMQY